ncbi:MAG: hypothetical protein PUE74_06440 [Faecalibacterium sp.]|nr:hypothetical protein [Faecalibacterium sp.]
MTNKKFKVAAMSMALTACVAAQPLIANAADEEINPNGAPGSAPQSEEGSTASAAASVSSDPVTNQQSEGAVDVIGDPAISVDYDHDNDKVTKDDSSTTTESTGTVNRDVPKESEPGAQQPSGDDQQPSGDDQQPSGDGQQAEDDLNNEQEGPKDGGSETEKKPIGTAEKTETETKDAELVLGKPTTTTTTTTNPDGSTTTTTTTTTDATLETTTKVEGEASAKTEEDSSEDVKDTLKEELPGGELSWDTKPDTKFGDYTVTGAVEKDGKKEFTLTKEDKIEGEMTGLDISKLIEAGYKDNGGGTYTLTKEFTDSQGQKQTITVKVDSSTATKTTSTTLTVTMEKTPHSDSKYVDESTDTGDSQLENRYPAQSEIKDEKGNILWTGSVAELLKDSPNGKVCYNKGGKTYTFTFTESSEGPDSNFNFSAEDAAKLLGEGYSSSNGKIYHTDGDKLTEVDYNQAIQKINLHIELTVSEEKKEENETVSKSDQTVAEATQAAEKNAAEAALKNALKEAASKAGITDDLDNALNDALKNGKISTDAPGRWEYKATVDGKEKTFVFTYDKTTVTTQRTEASDAEKNQVKTDNGEGIDDINKNTSTGSASVSGAVITWTESGQNAYEVIKDAAFAEGQEIDLKNIPTDARKEDLEGGGTRYTYTDAAGKKYELIYTAPTDEQLNQIKAKLLADGMTEENIKKSIENGDFTYVSWKITSPTKEDKVETEQIAEEKANLSSGNVKIEDKGNGNYTITVNNKTYKNMTTNDGGRTYTSVNGNTTTTIRVQTEALSSSQIKDLLTPTYGDTVKVDENGKATYTRTVDGKEVEVTINYSDAFQTNADVTIDTASSATATGHDEATAYQKLLDEINRLKKEAADRGEELFWDNTNLSKTEITIDLVKQIAHAVNYGSLQGQDLINFLEVQKKAAEATGDYYNGKSYKDTWSDGVGGKTYTNLTNKNTISHLDLGVDSTLTTLDNKSEDCILVPADSRAEGDSPLEFVWSDSAADLVNNNKKNINNVGLIERVTLDDEDGRGDGHYEFPRASWDNHDAGWYQDNNGNWHKEDAYENPTDDNAPTTSAYYRVTGTVAYGSLKDTKTGKMLDFDDKVKAQEEAEKYAKANGIDPSQITVVAVYPDQDRYSTPVYHAYLYKSNMTAYGYMTKESNTCINKSFNYKYDEWGHIRGVKYVGGYDLLLAKLTQVSKDQITGEQYKSYSYTADLFTRKKASGSSNALTQNTLEYTHKVPGPDQTEGQGTGYFGNYDVSYEQSFAWDDSSTESSKPRGTGSDSFFSFKKLFDQITCGSTDVSRKQGTITANYATTSDAEVTEAVKKTCVQTDSSVKYHYSYVERQELEPITDVKTVTTPADDDGDDEIIEEKVPDSPVLPGTPELPPVQDAKPDAPVLPADPALPAVQGAHALPQTGVNWLAAIGLALSGMTLMITGAFASLLGKNAKH